MINPSLVEEERSQVSPVIAARQNTSLYAWLEDNGRFRQSEDSDFDWSTSDEELLAEYSNSGDDSDEPVAA